jgi:hypothetical protein
MMSTTPAEAVYDIAVRALEAQEREVNSLRTRTGTLAAAAALAASLLGREAFVGSDPEGFVAWVATAAGLVALAVVLFASVFLLGSHDLTFGLDAAATFEEAQEQGALADESPEALFIGLTYGLSEIEARNNPTVQRLKAAFALSLGGVVVMVLGLGLGVALA